MKIFTDFVAKRSIKISRNIDFCVRTLLPIVSGKLITVGHCWSNGSDSAAVDCSTQVVGGSLATEGVRTALAQLFNLHGMHVTGLEPFVAHPSANDSGGKWY